MLALIAFGVACGIACACVSSEAGADPRFGDSAWVAPGAPAHEDSTVAGPRVAPRDHERRWETAVRAPFRVAFLPLRLVALGLESVANYVGPRYLAPKPENTPKHGRITPYFMLTTAKDVGAGPAIKLYDVLVPDSRFHLGAAWSVIDHRHMHFTETIRDRRTIGIRIRGDYDRNPAKRFFGIGNQTTEANASYYLLTAANAEAAVHLGASPRQRLRVMGGYSSMSPGRGSHATPLLEDVFVPAVVPFVHEATKELWYGVTGDLVKLDDEVDPSLGIDGRVDCRRASGRGTDDPDYDQWRVEGRVYLPVFAKRRVIAVRGIYAGVDPRPGSTMPFYRLAQNEGLNPFVAYSSGRFRDRQLVMAHVEYRWEILHRLSAIALYELGEVAPEAGAFTLRGRHDCWGGGLRLGRSDQATVRLEVAKSVEGLHASLALGSDF